VHGLHVGTSAASEFLLFLKLVELQLELVLLLHDRVKTRAERLILDLLLLDLGSEIADNLAQGHLGQLLLLRLREMYRVGLAVVKVDPRSNLVDKTSHLLLLHHGSSLLGWSQITVLFEYCDLTLQ